MWVVVFFYKILLITVSVALAKVHTLKALCTRSAKI